MPGPVRQSGTKDEFVTLSVELTGFDTRELWATGMVDDYRDVLRTHAGAERYARLVAAAAEGVFAWECPSGRVPPDVAELAEALTCLWYTGVWPGLDGEAAFLVSARAYAEGLVWRTFGGAAPGAAPRGFGSWAEKPAEAAGAGVLR
ncbi:hypothetical protein R6L23_04180 [Streptomyces sp. SR27]|uniref:hypothetical protein n=1 Tax=Streptomyces sp. SR27 TaxID=3076630 RepID=UPI00295A593F|nr:hypothetical protein [Streptomyces sp. SR27]MDV9187424.1 hypothetical protein [Streptomyces sp. SR27]